MTLTIELTGDIEQRLQEQAAASGYDVPSYVQHLLAESAAEDWPLPFRGESPEAFMARLRAMIERHAVRCGHVDDSRESIYAGRGE